MRDVIEKGNVATSYLTGGGMVIFGGMTANDLAVLAGVVFTALTFLVNLWFKLDRRSFDRRLAERDRRMMERCGGKERRDPRPNCATCPYREESAP